MYWVISLSNKKKTNSSIIFSLHLEIKMFNIKNERKAVFVKWASRSHLDVIEEKWYSNELLAKKKKRIFQLKKCNAKRNMRSSTNAREGGTLPPATRNNTSPIIMQRGYVKTVRSISCKKKTTNGQHYSALNKSCNTISKPIIATDKIQEKASNEK